MVKNIKQIREEITRKELAPMLDSFVSFASDKLGLKSMPSVRYKTDDDLYNSFAAYNPSSNELSISTMNRHPMDIFRSIAHELVHHKQNEDGRLGKDIEKEGATGSKIENEANSEAGKIMRWFAKANPDMFKKSYVVETNTAAIGGGIRGLGNVTGEVSPTSTSHYVTTNQTSGLWFDDGIDSYWLDKKGSGEYQRKAVKGFKTVRGNLNEGLNDPGKLKAIFLAGGPGSGKDYVMNSTLAGEGLKEVNSDVAFEFLMKKHGLDLEMPDEERVERDIVRGRAKNITKEQERLALAGRLGLIINGTADDLEKIKTIKKSLEADGYETMMVFVNTSNEVSRERNVERGKRGNRKVPDGTDKQGVPDNSPNIRQEKWDAAQKNIGELQKIFGNQNFAVLDNSLDIRKASSEDKEKVLSNFNRVRRMAQQFVRSENKNPAAKQWIEKEASKRGITQYQEPKRYKSLSQVRQSVPQVIHKPDNDMMNQARRLGLSYYGFGRFGRKVNGVNKVLFHSIGGKLVKVQNMNEEKKMKNDPCWKGYEMIGKKKKNGREVPNCVPVSEEEKKTAPKDVCWKGYEMIGMKKKNGRKVPNCVPVDEAFEDFVAEAKRRPQSAWEKMSAAMKKQGVDLDARAEEARKAKEELMKTPEYSKIKQEAMEASVQGGYVFGADGIGPTIGVPRAGTPYGFGYGSAYSSGLSESIVTWMQSEKTQQKFADKYGDLWEDKLIEAALRLEEAGCGCEHTEMKKKSIKKIREGMGGGINDMSPIPTQRKSEEQLNERGADSKGLYRSTESGAGLTAKGAKHFGVKTAVTTPPSKLNPGSKAAKRRKSFCARMGGMKGPMKDEKGRPTRKAMSLRRWNCEEQ